MATGIIINDKTRGVIVVRLLEGTASANGIPADGAAGDVLKASPSATQFFDLSKLCLPYASIPGEATIEIYETGASTGTLSIAYARLWQYSAASGKAFPAGTGTDADKGKLNNAGALGENASDKLRHREVVYFPGDADGIQCELGTITGTTPTFNVDLTLRF